MLSTGYTEVGGCRYPTNFTLVNLQREILPRFEEGRLGLELMPTKVSEMHQIILNKPDVFRGIQAFRGLNKPTPHASGHFNPHGKQCVITPGAYGEHMSIDEKYLTTASDPTSCGQPIDLTEPITTLQELLLHRRYNLIEQSIWNSLVYGSYRSVDLNGIVLQEQTFNTQNISVSIPWSDHDNSTPLNDLRCLHRFGRNTQARFDSSATIYMNQVTLNCILKNRNLDDIGLIGRDCGGVIPSHDAINTHLQANNLPMIQVYDLSWMDDNGNNNMYIPDGVAVIIGSWGQNSAQTVGNYYFTRNVVGCEVSSGPWTVIQDNCNTGDIPRKINVHDGHNGGAVIEYPSQVVTLQTGCVDDCPF